MPGERYRARGARPMRVVRHGWDGGLVLADGPPVNFCRPAVDPLFSSAIDVWQGAILAVVLTGMGSDGMRGGKDIVAAGGIVIAQAQASRVVWGIPGAAAKAPIFPPLLPLNLIPPNLFPLFSSN